MILVGIVQEVYTNVCILLYFYSKYILIYWKFLFVFHSLFLFVLDDS